MTKRSEGLDRLIIRSPCTVPWSEMEGGEARRSCAHCDREVFDFASLSEREIEARLKASRGSLCARITRQGGRLVVAPPTPESPSRTWTQTGRSPFLAPWVAAWLGLQATLAAAGEAAIRGRIFLAGGEPLAGARIVVRNTLDGRYYSAAAGSDGSFRVGALPGGRFDLEASEEGYAIDRVFDLSLREGESKSVELAAFKDETVVDTGVVEIVYEPLRSLFARSDLVAAVRIGASVVQGRIDDLLVIESELKLQTALKGRELATGLLRYRHSELASSVSSEGVTEGLEPGTWVLAYLRLRRERGPAGWVSYFETAGIMRGLEYLPSEERAPYLSRLKALAALERRARRGGDDSAAEMEWLVATTVEPATRREAAQDVWFLNSLERPGREDRSDAPPATLSRAQKGRLAAALKRTRGLDHSDLTLFNIVRRWDENGAKAWLVRRLRAQASDRHRDESFWNLQELARDLKDESLLRIVQAADERFDAIDKRWPEDSEDSDSTQRRKERAKIYRDLYLDFARALSETR